MGGGPTINIPPGYNNTNFTGQQAAGMSGLQGLTGNSLYPASQSLFGATFPTASSTSALGNISSGANALSNLNANSFGGLSNLAGLSGINGISPFNTYLQGSAIPGASALNQGAGSLLNAAFNPQTGLFNQELNNMAQNTNASLAARGLNQSGAGAQMYGNMLNQFLNNWSQQQIGNMATGLSGANSALSGAQGLLSNAGNVPLSQLISGLSAYQGGLGNAGNLLSSLNLLPNQAASTISGYGTNALNSGWASLTNQANLYNQILGNAQNAINSQNNYSSGMTNMAMNQAQGNKAGIGQGIGGLMNLGGSLGSAGIMANAMNPLSSAADLGGLSSMTIPAYSPMMIG